MNPNGNANPEMNCPMSHTEREQERCTKLKRKCETSSSTENEVNDLTPPYSSPRLPSAPLHRRLGCHLAVGDGVCIVLSAPSYVQGRVGKDACYNSIGRSVLDTAFSAVVAVVVVVMVMVMKSRLGVRGRAF